MTQPTEQPDYRAELAALTTEVRRNRQAHFKWLVALNAAILILGAAVIFLALT